MVGLYLLPDWFHIRYKTGGGGCTRTGLGSFSLAPGTGGGCGTQGFAAPFLFVHPRCGHGILPGVKEKDAWFH